MVIKKKICLLGSYGVGKTSLVRRFVYNKYEDKYLSTIGVHITKKIIDLPSENKFDQVELFIWDIANIEKFDSTVKTYLKGAHGAIFVFDLSRQNTIETLRNLKEEYSNEVSSSRFIYIANKIDLMDNLTNKIEQYHSKLNSDEKNIFFCSAKTGENVENAFRQLSIFLTEAV